MLEKQFQREQARIGIIGLGYVGLPLAVAFAEKYRVIGLDINESRVDELRKGIESLADGDRRLRLIDWLEVEVPSYFAGRILPVDAVVADRWGRLVAQAGRPLPAIDSLLAATALSRGLTLVTRNLRDFEHAGLQLHDPWSA